MSTIGKTDIVTIIGKGFLGAIPFVGPLVAEVVGAIIPNQRIDRIESLLKLLESKIPEEDKPKIKQRIISKESIDLIEDSFIQASRALSEERKEYIASLLKNSLINDDLKHIEYKRLLSILCELNDLQILILKLKSLEGKQPKHAEFWDTHKNALTTPLALASSSQTEIDKYTIYITHEFHLANLGLLRGIFNVPKKGELPEFDENTGMIKSRRYEITNLGRLLLRCIDQGG